MTRLVSHFKALKLFTSPETLWLYKITYSKVSGMSTLTVLSWWGHYAAYCRGIGICNIHQLKSQWLHTIEIYFLFPCSAKQMFVVVRQLFSKQWFSDAVSFYIMVHLLQKDISKLTRKEGTSTPWESFRGPGSDIIHTRSSQISKTRIQSHAYT